MTAPTKKDIHNFVREAKKESDERVYNVYGLMIDGIKTLALLEDQKGARVTIFDGQRLVHLGRAKALREAVALIESYRDKAFPPPKSEISPYNKILVSRIDNLNPNDPPSVEQVNDSLDQNKQYHIQETISFLTPIKEGTTERIVKVTLSGV